uniref:transcription factor TGA1-like n=1 Tax=Erigeron canadensis TaxID=72917 RepID=UPI001CB8BF87|nr:transcription factor TGA1-like [Erigeron canadensis]XP_043616841.1 transcription factor TGA1-like [Erigeron canadensis]
MATTTSTQFATSRVRMGIYDPLQQISMWEEAFGANLSPPNISPDDIMISEVNARLAANKTEYTSQESLGPSPDARATRNISDKLQRRLAQNREAARKSRLRKKAYVQQLESGRMKLAQLEQELERARRQGVYGGLLNTSSNMLSSNVINSGIATFEMEYELWVAEQRRKDDDLRKVLLTHTSEIELQIYVDSGLNHYYDLFRMKADAAKADVFYLMNGLWRTPVERFFQWIGGFRPSEILSILMPQLELTDTQLMKARSLRQSCEQAEEALSQGLEKLQQTLAQSITIDITGAGSYTTQMNSAMKGLEALEVFLNQADHLRQQTLQQMYQILTLIQAANALLVLGEYFQRLRVLSSIWSSRPRNPATVLS